MKNSERQSNFKITIKNKRLKKNHRNFKNKNFIEPFGLANLGNTCYFNSVLQYFLNSQLIKKKLLAHDCLDTLNCLIEALKKFYGDKTRSPDQIVNLFLKKYSRFQLYEQQDAHEFFMLFIEQLHKEISNKESKCNCLIHQLFSGKMKITYKCKCDNIIKFTEEFIDISLPVTDKNLKMILMNYLNEKITYFCKKCNKNTDWNKSVYFENIPPILCFHFKLFEQNGSTLQKLNQKIEFDPNFKINNVQYGLRAVINHYGSLSYGHYTSYIKKDGKWFYCNDSSVDEKDIKKDNAYILFYEKLD